MGSGYYWRNSGMTPNVDPYTPHPALRATFSLKGRRKRSLRFLSNPAVRAPPWQSNKYGAVKFSSSRAVEQPDGSAETKGVHPVFHKLRLAAICEFCVPYGNSRQSPVFRKRKRKLRE